MTKSEQIRNYVTEELRSGRIRPGERIPSFRELAEKFGVSYLTARNAMLKLEQEHIVEIRSHGTFLAGGKRLKVLICSIPSTIPCGEMQKLLVKHLANTELNLEIEVIPRAEAVRSATARETFRDEYGAVISFTGYMNDYNNTFPATRLNAFPEHEKIKSRLLDLGNLDMTYLLPFSIFTYQMGINRALMRKIDFNPQKITRDFKWWDEYAAKCRKNGLVPASIFHTEKSCHLLSSFLYPMLSILPYEKEKYRGTGPLFATEAGNRFFQVVKDTHVSSGRENKNNFLQNGCPLILSLGSWAAVQNQDPARKDVNVNELAIVPYRTRDGRKICFNTFECLELYLPPKALPENTIRIRQLIELMYSHDFQIEYCSRTGAISVLKDIYPAEYYWNRTLEWNGFIPAPGDVFIFPFLLFHSDLQVAWSILLENIKFFHADFTETAMRMDRKR